VTHDRKLADSVNHELCRYTDDHTHDQKLADSKPESRTRQKGHRLILTQMVSVSPSQAMRVMIWFGRHLSTLLDDLA
jgi:hypothetical protein